MGWLPCFPLEGCSLRKWYPLLCAALLGALVSPSLAQSQGAGSNLETVKLLKVQTSPIIPGQPPFCTGLTAVYTNVYGLGSTDPMNVAVEYDLTWKKGSALTAGIISDLETLLPDGSVGGYPRVFAPTSLPLSYNAEGIITVWGLNVIGSSFYGASAPVFIDSPVSPYLFGLTVFNVHDAAGKPIPNVIVSANNFSRDIYSVEWDTSYPPFSTGRFVVGQGVFVAGDQQYPPGLASDHYMYFVKASGYTTCHAYFPTGTQSAYQTVEVTLMPDGTSSPITVSPTTDADNLDKKPVVTTGGGSGGILDLSTLNGFVGSFFDKLKAMLIDLFTPQQADIDAVRAAANQLFSWGPFGLAANIQAAWGASQSDYGLTNSDARYWYFPLSMGHLTSYAIMTTPKGYTPGADRGLSSPNNRTAAHAAIAGERAHYEVQQFDQYGRSLRPSAVTTQTTAMDINQWQALIPDHWDCRPYSSDILVMRGLMWAGGWISFLLFLRNKFMPSLRI